MWEFIYVGLYFNPHSHEGSDNISNLEVQSSSNFNPHSHEGSDYTLKKQYKGTEISIHTPTKGVTEDPHAFTKSFVISIHTPTKGVTAQYTDTECKIRYFNPHSHEGSDLLSSKKRHVSRISIHTPTKGVTNTLPTQTTKHSFQSTLPRRE